jgi:hypothetical protein
MAMNAAHLAQANLPPAPDPSTAPPPPDKKFDLPVPAHPIQGGSDSVSATGTQANASGTPEPGHSGAPNLAVLIGVVSIALLGVALVLIVVRRQRERLGR